MVQDDSCAANKMEGLYCLNENGHIPCQNDGDCPPFEVDLEEQQKTRFYCGLNYGEPLGICFNIDVPFCLTVNGEEEAAICNAMEEQLREELREQEEKDQCDLCGVAAAPIISATPISGLTYRYTSGVPIHSHFVLTKKPSTNIHSFRPM